ncbi:MAG: hypothetical protein DME59_14895 [Verrucomicrobia bacterium]|nr:MAG: hypothetical protein DME59_14895 [Verrucomicrobiota bacterium]
MQSNPTPIKGINNMNKIKYLATALIAIAGLGFQQAKADTYSFDLNVGNSAISGFSGPYANVSITTAGPSATSATVTFTAYSGFLIGDGSSANVNVNGAGWTIGNFSWTGGNGSTSFSDGGSGNVDGFGTFNQTTNNHDGFASAVTSVTFTLTLTSGSWANAMSVLVLTTGNNGGWLAAAHIFAIGNSSISTGFAAGNGTAGVPDGGATVMLLGAALGLLGVARRYLAG